jgi:hypothetical protein
VYVEGDPDNRYMVELFMGSPRPFELRAVPCGAQQLVAEVLSGERLTLVESDLGTGCAGGYRQARLVFEPVRRYLERGTQALR